MMTLILFAGFVIQHLDAQKCCLPGPICPPGCCKTSCSFGAKSAAASSGQTGEVKLASFMLIGQGDNLQSADSSFLGMPAEQTTFSKAVSCHPSCIQNPSGKTAPTSSASVESAVKQTKVREKS